MKKTLKSQLEAEKSHSMPSEPIKNFLLKAAKRNKQLETEILNPDKNFEECLKYVKDQVQEALEGSLSGWIDDEKVYQMAQDYYLGQPQEESLEEPQEEPQEEKQEEKQEDAMIDGQLCFF